MGFGWGRQQNNEIYTLCDAELRVVISGSSAVRRTDCSNFLRPYRQFAELALDLTKIIYVLMYRIGLVLGVWCRVRSVLGLALGCYNGIRRNGIRRNGVEPTEHVLTACICRDARWTASFTECILGTEQES